MLDGYLDQVIESEVYRQKKNELFEQKLKLQEKIAKIQKGGSSWLEPMKEFINCALQAQKIARAKNKSNELKLIAQKVGSNYSLFNRRLSATLNFPFRALAAGGGAASALPSAVAISTMVGPTGLEPVTSSMSPRRSSQLSYGPVS